MLSHKEEGESLQDEAFPSSPAPPLRPHSSSTMSVDAPDHRRMKAKTLTVAPGDGPTFCETCYGAIVSIQQGDAIPTLSAATG